VIIAILLVLLVFSICSLALVSGAETAFFSLSSMQIKAFKRDQDPRKRQVAHLLENPREFLVTFIIVIVLLSLIIQNLISTLLNHQGSWLLNIGIPLGVNLILGEVIPKSLAMPSNVKVSCKTVYIVAWLQKVLYPVRKILSWLTSLIMPILFFFLRKEKEISIDELQHALKESKDRGVLLHEETELIRGYLRLQESMVKDLMRPREEILYVDQDEPLSRLIHLFVEQECTRILFCEDGLDKLKGIISSRIFFQNKEGIAELQQLIPFLKPPYFVPETLKADVLLKQMYEKKETLAIVVSEYGSITGLIAMEDLVEVVVGEIVDLRDRETFFTRAGEDVIIASGKLELAQLEEIFDVSLESLTHRVTVGGWIIEELGDIPKTGVKHQTKDFFFHILSADPTRIRRVYIRKLTPVKLKKQR
jgi:putative hemolysin